MAPGNSRTDYLVVQVSAASPLRMYLVARADFAGCSFLVKDAQQDLAGERLKA